MWRITNIFYVHCTEDLLNNQNVLEWFFLSIRCFYNDRSTAFRNSTTFLMVSSSDDTAFSQAVRALIPNSFACKTDQRIVWEIDIRKKENLNKKEIYLALIFLCNLRGSNALPQIRKVRQTSHSHLTPTV